VVSEQRQAEEMMVEPGAPSAAEPEPVGDDDAADRIAPLPGEVEFVPVQPPPTTVAPRIDPVEFGVGWPAAIAVGVALLAVLIMALMWRRDEPAWVRSSSRR